MADITVTGNQAYFNDDAKFFKDVYIYGTLYYDGFQVTQGTQGTQGLQGLQGLQGISGSFAGQGVQGSQGSQGIQGLTGYVGSDGPQGVQGSQGTQGLQGLQGTQGSQGIQGLQGLQGTQGTQGTQGLQGVQGISGSFAGQGVQGSQGSQGTQGLQGLQGLQGTRGFPGTDLGPTVKNILYVTEDGNDTNSGLKLGDAKRTIGAALTAATTGTTIKVSAGSYIENNPLIIPEQVSIVGDSLREVSVSPQNSNKDLFYVANGDYIAEMSFTGSLNNGKAIFAFNPNQIGYFNQSPYIQNCTNFIPNSIGLKIDGNNAIGPLKSMVIDSYTQYNQGGIGCSITHEGYAQLVSLFTICDDIAIYCGSGGACDLTNSNSSFGNYGLVADGIGPLKYTGIITSSAGANSDTFVLDLNVPTLNVTAATYDNITGLTTITVGSNHNFNVGMGVSIVGLAFTCSSGPGIVTYPSGNKGYVFEVARIPSSTSFEIYVGVSTLQHTYQSGGTVKINVSRPFDGQVIYFDTLYYVIDSVTITSSGSGYTQNVDVTFSNPSTSWGIPASAVAEVENGVVVNVEMVSSGRGYETTPSVTFSSPTTGINTATGTANLIPSYYVISSSTPISSGICTIVISDNVPYNVGVGTTVPFFKQSRILASGHSLEYIGTGVSIASALPQSGGVPIQRNETDARNGGLVVFTTTDQSGNFRIGDGVVINQQTGTISGASYTKSLFSTVTPFILALGGE